MPHPTLAIHHNPGSFSDRWEEQCRKHRVPFISVDLFHSGILRQLRDKQVGILLFDVADHMSQRTRRAAASCCKAAELAGIRVFPNHANYWHCDDKIAQHYLLESLNLPRCETWIFFDESEAMDWTRAATYPKVFKLRCGAGSSNVRLVQNCSQAQRLVRTMFGRGLQPVGSVLDDLSTKFYKHLRRRDWLSVVGRVVTTIRRIRRSKQETPRERGYVYFQDFLPKNECDTRVTVIGNRAFAYRRFVRPNDFRASGSGRVDGDKTSIDLDIVRDAFEAAKRIGSECLAFDFVYDRERKPIILEMCYRFIPDLVYQCPGHWDRELRFHCGHTWPQDAILENMLNWDIPGI